jgi:hypothetical protein
MAEHPSPYYLAASYATKHAAGKAYTPIERIIFEADCDVSAYRFFLPVERIWYVVVVGERPPAPVEERIKTILTTLTQGQFVAHFPPEFVQMLVDRRNEQRTKGDWVEVHYDSSAWEDTV